MSVRTGIGPVTIRRARAGELAEVGALTVRAYARVEGYSSGPDNYEALLADAAARARTCRLLVATDRGGALLGTVTYVPAPGPYAEFTEPDWAGIRMLAVAPEAWGHGVGSALVRACIARAEASGRRGIALHTTEAMTTAQRLYPRLGFRRAPERDRITPGGTRLLGFTWRNPDVHEPGLPEPEVARCSPRAGNAGSGVTITEVPPDSPEVAALVDALMAELTLRYGPSGDDERDDPFRPADVGPGGAVLLARSDGGASAGQPLGTATLRPLPAVHGEADTEAELKRMVVAPEARGRGVGAALLGAVEAAARRRGYRRLVLETGTRQPEAIRLYRRAGYTPIAPYGWYRDAPLSRCFGKDL